MHTHGRDKFTVFKFGLNELKKQPDTVWINLAWFCNNYEKILSKYFRSIIVFSNFSNFF